MDDLERELTPQTPYFVICKKSLGKPVNAVNYAIKHHHCVPLGGVAVIEENSQKQYLQAVMLSALKTMATPSMRCSRKSKFRPALLKFFLTCVT